MQVALQVNSLRTGINLLCQEETKGKKCYTVNEVCWSSLSKRYL